MKYELLKLIKNKIVILCILISVSISLYFAYKSNENVGSNGNTGVKHYTGEFTQEKYDNINNEYMVARSNYEVVSDRVKEYNEDEVKKYATISKEEAALLSEDEINKYKQNFYLWTSIRDNADNCIKAQEYREKVVKNSINLLETGDEYTKNINKKAYEIYSKKVDYKIFSTDLFSAMSSELFTVNYADYINIVCIIIMVCLIFLIEHSSNTYSMIYSSYRGRLRTYINKSMVVSIISIMLAVVTTLIEFIPYVGKDGFMEIWNSDIQNNGYYNYSPYSYKFYQIVLWLFLLRILAYLAIVAIMTFITTIFKKSIVPFSTGALIFCGGFAMYSRLVDKINLMEISGASLLKVADKYKFYRMYTPFGLLRNAIKYFAVYEPNNICNKPVTTVTIAVCIHITYIIVFFLSGYVVYRFRFRKKGV